MRRKYESDSRSEGESRRSRSRKTHSRQNEQSRYHQAQNQFLHLESPDTHCLKQENIPPPYSDVSKIHITSVQCVKF